MITTIRIRVLFIFIPKFIHRTRSFSILVGRHSKIIMIDKVVARIVWWVYIYHLDLT